MKQFTSKTQKIGQIGEEIACKYLKNKGFSIIERNFTLKCGEIDIIAEITSENSREIRFFEVKTLFYKDNIQYFKPEDNINREKIRKIAKTCLFYLDIRRLYDSIPWQIDMISVIYNEVTREAKIRHHECIY